MKQTKEIVVKLTKGEAAEFINKGYLDKLNIQLVMPVSPSKHKVLFHRGNKAFQKTRIEVV